MSTRNVLVALLAGLASVVASPHLHGQGRGGPPPPPRAGAPIDLTGYWVSVVSEDWRFRMMTPPKGEYLSVPMTPEARRIADAWDPAADQARGDACKAYGAAAIMRIPSRLHITWQDDTTLSVEIDAGTQRRLFSFGASPAASVAPSWQGRSIAQWERPGAGRGAPPARGGSLRVVTTDMRAGYLRRNGVPYSDKAVLTEHFDLGSLPGGVPLLLVTAVVEDPQYLAQPFIVTSHFKKEADGAKWDPTPCSTTW